MNNEILSCVTVAEIEEYFLRDGYNALEVSGRIKEGILSMYREGYQDADFYEIVKMSPMEPDYSGPQLYNVYCK